VDRVGTVGAAVSDHECPTCAASKSDEVAWLHEQLEQAVAKAAGEFARGLKAARDAVSDEPSRIIIGVLIEQEEARG
jgi:hypothetical protein